VQYIRLKKLDMHYRAMASLEWFGVPSVTGTLCRRPVKLYTSAVQCSAFSLRHAIVGRNVYVVALLAYGVHYTRDVPC